MWEPIPILISDRIVPAAAASLPHPPSPPVLVFVVSVALIGKTDVGSLSVEEEMEPETV